MRISDWSSDVCSSDLADARRRGIPARTAAVAARRGAEDRAVGPASEALRAAPVRDLAAQPPDAAVQRARTERHRHAAAPLADHRQRRSEEHTSELQSLMRISYAVFCLKKKKTQKTKN